LEVPLDDAARAGSRAALGGYYDRLAQWTAAARRFGYGGGHDHLTVHRALADPRAGGRPTVTRLHDVLLSALPTPPSGHVLDAGCGLGGTMLDLAGRCSARFTGVTLSEQQAAVGRAAAAKTGLADRIAIEVGSYDSPPPGPFDLAIAIESLAHSPHPEKSIGAIVARLAPGGRLAVVDDMPEPQARGSRDLAWFQSGWHAPVLPGAADWMRIRRDGVAIVNVQACFETKDGARKRHIKRMEPGGIEPPDAFESARENRLSGQHRRLGRRKLRRTPCGNRRQWDSR